MITTNKALRIGALISILVLIFGFFSTRISVRNNRSIDKKIECFGIIDGIKIDTLDRGTPYFLIDSSWVYIGSFGYSIRSYAQKGDSISKIKGEEVLRLYRKRSSDDYELLKFVESWK